MTAKEYFEQRGFMQGDDETLMQFFPKTIYDLMEGYAASKQPKEGDLVCPFCSEGDFDTIGLKMHLTRWCEKYLQTQTP